MEVFPNETADVIFNEAKFQKTEFIIPYLIEIFVKIMPETPVKYRKRSNFFPKRFFVIVSDEALKPTQILKIK